MRYIDQSTRDEAKEAYRNHIPLDRIAGHLGITVAELRRVLELPALQPVPTDDQDQDFDLWAFDDSKEVL
jgi:hypothetical protein